MEGFNQIDTKNVSNVFNQIGSEWMLITAGDQNKFNTMTASWGGFGVLWYLPVSFIFVRPQRYTFEFLEKHAVYSLCFFDQSYKKILNFCGSKSGKVIDKIKETGLKPIHTPSGAIAFEQASLIIECRKLYAGQIDKNNFIDTNIIQKVYAENDFHQLYIGEITGSWKNIKQ
jgi:flavin reductase (DIM6/NTAB) family NADH-FMN oxidoreductase RutF